MKLADLHLAIVYVNLAHREDRRAETEYQLAMQGLHGERQPGIRADTVRDPWGFQNERRYACSLAKRLAIRRGMQTGADAVLLLEDDIVFHPEFHERLAEIELPEDWGLFFLGCRHIRTPVPVRGGVVRCTFAIDNHAMVVRRSQARIVMAGLRGSRRGAGRTILYSDHQLAALQGEVPMYAAYPNLAWQACSQSDACDERGSRYHTDGRQVFGEPLRSLEPAGPANVSPTEEAPPVAPDESPAARVELPFLRRPRAYVFQEAFPFCGYVNLARRADRKAVVEREFARHKLVVVRQPAIDARWVRDARGQQSKAAYGCSLSHRLILRAGRRDGAAAVLCLEDDVVFHPQFVALAESLPLPEDWGVFYFGCNHMAEPEIAAPGIVRVRYAYATHAFAVRGPFIPRVLRALAGRGRKGQVPPCDVALSELTKEIPIYAAFPNLAWQRVSYSDLLGVNRKPFEEGGAMHAGGRPWLPLLESRMAELINAANR